jgi:pimeloyl-ACP methyl ester carboxylesterase
MMAPIPTTGISGCGFQLTTRQPTFVVEATRAMRGKYTEHTARVMREVYFSPDVTHEEFAAFKPMVQPESMTAIIEMMALAWRPPLRHADIPALVMGGQYDALFPASQLHFTAASWNAETCIIPRGGHMLMMEPHWKVAATRIDNWLGRNL